jgi:DNA-binding Lrp family transcriptional regulator
MYDDLDYEIIRILNKNARAAAADIARQVDANPRTVRKRIDRLMEMEGLNLVSIINPESFGYTAIVDLYITTEPHKEPDVIKKILEYQEITFLAYGQNQREVTVEARFKDNEHMSEFVRKKLDSIPEIVNTQIVLIPKIMMDINHWLPTAEDIKERGIKRKD